MHGFKTMISSALMALLWILLPVHSLVMGQTTSYSSGPTCAGNISSTEYAALQGLYSSTDGPNWLWNSGLNQSMQQWVFPSRLSAPCEDHWEGISCGIASTSIEQGDTCYIASLVLPLMNLRGRLPSCLGSLSLLTTLDLNHNTLTGSIPSQLYSLGLLTELSLNSNRLTGSIPSQVAGLSAIVLLDLYTNSLTGSIPPELDGLSSLAVLNLDDNLLSGLIQTGLGSLASLSILNLNNNRLNGSIPSELQDLGSLVHLNLGGNFLTGSIPSQLGALGSLVGLDLNLNSLTGSVPSALGMLHLLLQVDIGFNSLTGPIPSELEGLGSLVSLGLNNNLFSGPIPPEIGSLTSLTALYLDDNMLSGSIPYQLGNLSSLAIFTVGVNALTGPIPSTLGSLSSLLRVHLNINFLTGSIPWELGGLASLVQLDLGRNMLRGPIPSELVGMGSLVALGLNTNSLTGSIPSELARLSMLALLYLNTNSLMGSIPSQLGKLSVLTALELNTNYLTGPLPTALGALNSLIFLYLYQNTLTGSIPSQLGSLQSLVVLGLSSNAFTGSIPPELGMLGATLTELNLYSNFLAGSMPLELGSLHSLTLLILNNNLLTGPIPFQLGGLGSLIQLALSSNSLTGSIPTQLGKLSSLTQMTLNSNSLVGCIPAELTLLELIQELNLAGNRLVGEIPGAMGDLSQCYLLNLSSNALTGTVPSSLGLLGSKLIFHNISKINKTVIYQNKTVVLDFSQNLFTGTIPAALFSTNIQTMLLHSNCFQGSLPEEICSATLLQTLVLDKLTSGEGCALRVFGFKASFTSNLLDGSIPGCVWSMPLLQTLHVSGNGLKGTLGEIQQSSQLSVLDASNNFLTGSIPKSLQKHTGLQQLLLGGNKLSGTLDPSFTVPNMTNLGLAVNRLSGNIPASFYDSPGLELDVLLGNIFYCIGDHLPANDPSVNDYVCGSDALNDALIAWGICIGTVAVMFLISFQFLPKFLVSTRVDISVCTGYCYHCYKQSSAWWQTYSDTMASPSSVGFSSFMHAIYRVRLWLCSGGIIIATVGTSLYVGLKSAGDAGTLTQQYTWITSSAFSHGTGAAVTVALCVCVSIAGGSTIMHCIISPIKVLYPSNPELGVKDKSWRNGFQRFMMQLLSLGVPLVVNVAYVYLADNIPAKALVVVQAAMGLFKLFWKQVYINKVINWMRQNHSDLSSQGILCHDFLMSVFVFVVVPCFASLGTDSRCLYLLIKGEKAVPSSFSITTFVTLCFTEISSFSGQTYEQCPSFPFKQELTISNTPPWLYSYQCTSALLSNYVPVLLLTYAASGILVPLLQCGLLLVLDSKGRCRSRCRSIHEGQLLQNVRIDMDLKDQKDPIASDGLTQRTSHSNAAYRTSHIKPQGNDIAEERSKIELMESRPLRTSPIAPSDNAEPVERIEIIVDSLIRTTPKEKLSEINSGDGAGIVAGNEEEVDVAAAFVTPTHGNRDVNIAAPFMSHAIVDAEERQNSIQRAVGINDAEPDERRDSDRHNDAEADLQQDSDQQNDATVRSTRKTAQSEMPFQAERLKVDLLLDLTVLLTFGLAVPLLALAIIVKQISTGVHLRLLIGRFLSLSRESTQFHMHVENGRFLSQTTVSGVTGLAQSQAQAENGRFLSQSTAGGDAELTQSQAQLEALAMRCGEVNLATVAILFLVIFGFWSAMVFDMVADVYGDATGGVASLVVFLGWTAMACVCRWVALKRRATEQQQQQQQGEKKEEEEYSKNPSLGASNHLQLKNGRNIEVEVEVVMTTAARSTSGIGLDTIYNDHNSSGSDAANPLHREL